MLRPIAVQESGENGKGSAQPNTASIPLQKQENVQETVRTICPTPRGIRGPYVGAMDSRGHKNSGESAKAGGKNDFRIQRTHLRGKVQRYKTGNVGKQKGGHGYDTNAQNHCESGQCGQK